MAMYFVDYENVNSLGLKGITDLEENDKVYIFYTEPGNVKSTTITMTAHFDIMKSKADIEYFCVECGGKNALDFQLSTFLGKCIAENKDGEFAIISNDKGFGYVSGFWENELGIEICRTNSIAKVLDKKALRMKSNDKEFDEIQNDIADRYADIPEEFEDFADTYDEIIIDGMVFRDPDNLPEITEENLIKADEILSEEDKTEIFELPEIKIQNPEKEVSQTNEKTNNYFTGLSDEHREIICNVIKKSKDKQAFHVNLCAAFGQSMGAEIYRLLKPEFESLKILKNNKEFTQIADLVIRLTEKSATFSDKQHDILCNVIEKSKDKQELHNNLVLSFGQKEGTEIYRLLKSEFESLKSMT